MRVLIVDDENLICEWLEFCISKNPSCQLVGIAHNGKEGLDLFQKYEPDLVLTDIKMPIMNGLELLRAIRARSADTAVVLLTAFAEFEMARQAIRDGANEYLLKTEMNNDLLQQILNKAIANCTDSGQEPGDNATAQAHAIVRKLLRQPEPLSDQDLTSLCHCGLHWRNNGLFALAVWKQRLMYGGLTFPESSTSRRVTGFDYTDRIYLVVANLPRALSPVEKNRLLREYAHQLQQLNHCMVGVSSITDEMSMMPAMIREAALSLSQGFYEETIRVYYPQGPLGELEKKNRDWCGSLSGLRAQLYQQSEEKRYQLLSDFLRETKAQKVGEVDVLTKYLSDCYDLFYAQAVSLGLEAESPEQVRNKLLSSISMEECSQQILLLAEKCSERSRPTQPRSKAVQLTLKYIQANFAQSLSLEQAASEVHLTPEYLSRIFKEETGVSFVSCLTDVRLRHSVHLLESTALRVQDIALAVGYPNVSYFSTIFKKKYAMSPYEYRQRSELG